MNDKWKEFSKCWENFLCPSADLITFTLQIVAAAWVVVEKGSRQCGTRRNEVKPSKWGGIFSFIFNREKLLISSWKEAFLPDYDNFHIRSEWLSREIVNRAKDEKMAENEFVFISMKNSTNNSTHVNSFLDYQSRWMYLQQLYKWSNFFLVSSKGEEDKKIPFYCEIEFAFHFSFSICDIIVLWKILLCGNWSESLCCDHCLHRFCISLEWNYILCWELFCFRKTFHWGRKV